LSGNIQHVKPNFLVMNSLKNRVILIGRLGQNPETKTIDKGKKVTHFTLATDDSYKNADGQRISEATWHNIVAWNGLADISDKYLKKGKQVAVEGRIVYRTYEDKNGVTKNITEIVLNDLVLLGSGKSDSNADGSRKGNGKDQEGEL
jgi:single-strand DNA-binding protein